MSADGSWSVCTHEHLAVSLFFSTLRLLQCHVMQIVDGVFALMNICQIAVLLYLRLPQH
jgi:TRAP-type mannitol/chloroaromatic compound transport system permease small subunit